MMLMDYKDDTCFAIRAYWKHELALASFPTAKSKHVAVWRSASSLEQWSSKRKTSSPN